MISVGRLGGGLFLLGLLEGLEGLLPPLGSQRAVVEPFVYAHFFVPDRDWSYYAIEGSRVENEYHFFGFLIDTDDENQWRWTKMPLLELASIQGCTRDDAFVPSRLTDAVPLPYE